MQAVVRRLGLLLVPDAAMAVAFYLAWTAPGSAWATAPSEVRPIMALEGLAILASACVGIYLGVARVLFPPILLAIGWFLWHAGPEGRTWILWGFAGRVVVAFTEAVAAHRGVYGNARVNPAHPARRYDRMLLLYAFTAPALLAGWAAWGTLYFGLLSVCDSILRGPFDRIPQGILRSWRRAVVDDETRARLGLCAGCLHVQPAIPVDPPRRWVRCQLSVEEPRFPEYPVSPVRACAGFRPRDTEGRSSAA